MSERAPAAVRLAVMATAFATLAYEISLTRIFSVLFRAPYVFLILSIAICGLGLGSYLAARDRPRRPADDEASGAVAGESPVPGAGASRDDAAALAWPALAFAWLLPAPILVLLTVGRGLIASANGTAVAVMTLAPYVAAGLLLARAFRLHPDQAGRLYAFDLGGAGLAAVVTLPLLGLTGGLGVPLLLGALAVCPAVALAWRGGAAVRGVAVASAVVLLPLALIQGLTGFLGLPPVTSTDAMKVKPLFQELAAPAMGAQVLMTHWSPVARTDVVKNAGSETLYIWTDGDVPTQMEPFRGDLGQMAYYQGFVGFVPFALQPEPGRVLCIGPGGGLDVLLALLGGARAIEPVELNPGIANVTEAFKGFYGDLYHRPEVTPGLIIDEGRSYLSRSPHQYDVIYSALAKSATTQQGGMALVDNHLYTVEAFRQYLEHLAPGGLLAMLMQEAHLVDRNLVTAVQALAGLGLSGRDVLERVAWLEVPGELEAGPYRQLLLLRNGPFEPELAARLETLANERHLRVRLLPGRPPEAPYDRLLAEPVDVTAYAEAVSQAYGPLRAYKGGPYIHLNFSPVTDDRPFYADLSPGLHPFLARLLKVTVVIGLVALVLGLVEALPVTGGVAAAGGLAGYFGLLGAAFLLVEVALIQKLVLVLGYPTLSLTVILFSLLLGSAVGGLLANRGSPAAAVRRLGWLLPLLIVALAGFAGGVGPLSARLLTAPLAVRCAVVAGIVGLLGILMGQPFPTGLRRAGQGAPRLVATAWAINGVLSVTGSVLAASVASRFGYRAVLASGAGLYLLALLTLQVWAPRADRWLPAPARGEPGGEEPGGGGGTGGRGQSDDGPAAPPAAGEAGA